MAYSNSNPGGGQDADMFSDGPQPPAKMAETEEPSEGQTAIVPKSLCPGMNPGDTIELKIVAAHDNDYEVQYSHGDEEKGSEEGQEGAEEEMASPPDKGGAKGGEMAALME